jgi:hypothetical protein
MRHKLGWLLALAHCLLLWLLASSLLIWSASSVLVCLCLKCSPPWNRFLVYRLGDTLSKGKFFSVIQVVVMQRLSHFYENTCSVRRCLAMDAFVVNLQLLSWAASILASVAEVLCDSINVNAPQVPYSTVNNCVLALSEVCCWQISVLIRAFSRSFLNVRNIVINVLFFITTSLTLLR